MAKTVAQTISDTTREHLKKGNYLFGQCVTAVGWVGGTIPEMTEEEGIVELDMEPLISSKEQIELNDKLSKHGQNMSEPANLILPFLIYNLEGSDRDEFTDDMPWILKNFVVPIIWKSKWEKMKPFLLA